MRRSLYAWGIVVSTLLAIAVATVWVLNSATYSAHATVERYLTALAEGRTGDAARIAGVDIDSVTPLPNDPDIRVTEPIVTGGVAHDGVVTVEARATVAGHTVDLTAVMVPAPALGGIFTQWAFAEAPTGTVSIDSRPIDAVLVNGVIAKTTTPLLVLAPGVVSVESASSWFDTTAQSVVVSAGSSSSVSVSMRPSSVFRTTVTDAIVTYLDDCATQSVMFPVQCPFGAQTDNSIHDGPRWTIVDYPALRFSRTAGDIADGAWTVRGTGVVELEATLVDNATGALFPVGTRQQLSVVARVTGLNTDSPRVTVLNTVTD